MTEEELTEMALLKAQAIRNQEQAEQTAQTAQTAQIKTPNPAEGIKQPQAQTPELTPELTPEPEVKIPAEFKEVEIGENKVIHYKSWTGKTKKKLVQFSNEYSTDDMDNIETQDSLLQILIYDNLFEKDIYLNTIEEQYLVLLIKNESINETISFAAVCPKCSVENIIEDKFKSCVSYEKNKYPLKDEKFDCTYVDIYNKKEFEKTTSDYLDSDSWDGVSTKLDLEIASHIQKDGMGPVKIMDWMDELSLKDLKEITKNLEKVQANIIIKKRKKCQSCGTVQLFKTNEVTDLFSEIV